MTTIAAHTRLGLILLGMSLIAAGIAAVLYWVSSTENWNFGPLLFAMIASIGTFLLGGFGIKKLAT